ncbi:MAG: Lrp/AsnC family transcriptional regulator [Gammaproteobacteria bacterium]
MDNLDRMIINNLQGGLPISEHPFAQVAEQMGITEDELIQRLQQLLAAGALSRFGPMYHAERLGGAVSLAAMKIPEADLDRVASLVNSYREVAHNYVRDHAFNLWFVLAAESDEQVHEALNAIQERSGFPVYNMPKLEEFYVGLRFDV